MFLRRFFALPNFPLGFREDTAFAELVEVAFQIPISRVKLCAGGQGWAGVKHNLWQSKREFICLPVLQPEQGNATHE
jgi:hypothetical protein